MEVQQMEECCASFKPQQPHSSSWSQLRGLYFFTSYAHALLSSTLPSWKFRLGSARLCLLCLRFLAAAHVCKFLSALPKLKEA